VQLARIFQSAATASSTTAASQNNQTLVESEDPPEKAIFTESRKMAAVVGGLVFVALAILLLTIRYIRVTKPVAAPVGEPVAAEVPERPTPASVPVDDADVFVLPDKEPAAGPADATVPAATAREATDHEGADADWEPRTDEHQRVEIPSASAPARPSAAARRKALGGTPG